MQTKKLTKAQTGNIESMLKQDSREKSIIARGNKHKCGRGGGSVLTPTEFSKKNKDYTKLAGPCISYNLNDRNTWPEYLRKEKESLE